MACFTCLASPETAVGDLDVTASADAAIEAVTSVILVSPAVAARGARRPGAVAEMSARPSPDRGRRRRMAQRRRPVDPRPPGPPLPQFAGYAVVSPRLFV